MNGAAMGVAAHSAGNTGRSARVYLPLRELSSLEMP
jgi:hypothetical protein